MAMAVMAAAGAKRHSEDEEEDEAGELVFTDVETSDEGFDDGDGDAVDTEGAMVAVERGDRSWTWRWPATPSSIA